MRRIVGLVAAALAFAVLTGCAMFENSWDNLNRAWQGTTATMMTFDENGQLMDKMHGTGFHFERDTRFDTTSQDSEGKSTSNADSQVILVNIGSSSVSHVGSTAIIAEDGLVPIAGAQTTIQYDSEDAAPGVPWVNNLKDKYGTLFQGKAKTLVIRSQNGSPIAVYAGNEVTPFGTEIPKSTQFRVDGKVLLVYRSDYTVYDSSLLR